MIEPNKFLSLAQIGNWRSSVLAMYHLDLLRPFLKSGGYEIKEIRGTEIRDKESLFNEFSQALGFPSYFGRNWDAFNDCVRDLIDSSVRDKAPLAILILDADVFVARDLRSFVHTTEILSDLLHAGAVEASNEGSAAPKLFLLK